MMNTYQGHQFLLEIVSQAVWSYFRFNLNHRDAQDLFAEQSVSLSYQSIRYLCVKFGTKYSHRLKRKHKEFGDAFYMDKVRVTINGVRRYL